VVDFAAKVEEVYCRCLQHKLKAVQLLKIAAQKGKGLYSGRQRSINHRVLRQVQIFDSWPVGLPG